MLSRKESYFEWNMICREAPEGSAMILRQMRPWMKVSYGFLYFLCETKNIILRTFRYEVEDVCSRMRIAHIGNNLGYDRKGRRVKLERAVRSRKISKHRRKSFLRRDRSSTSRSRQRLAISDFLLDQHLLAKE